MGIFGESDHIKKGKDLHSGIKSIKYVKPEAKKALESALKKSVLTPSGLSKKEAIDAIKKLEKDGDLDHHQAYNLKKKL